MSPTELLAELHRHGITVGVTSDGRLRLSGTSEAALGPVLRAAVQAQRAELLALLAGPPEPQAGEVAAAPVSGQRTVSRRTSAGTRPVDRLSERVPSPGAARETSDRSPAPTIPAAAVVGAPAVDVAQDLDPPTVQVPAVASAPAVVDVPAASPLSDFRSTHGILARHRRMRESRRT